MEFYDSILRSQALWREQNKSLIFLLLKISRARTGWPEHQIAMGRENSEDICPLHLGK